MARLTFAIPVYLLASSNALSLHSSISSLESHTKSIFFKPNQPKWQNPITSSSRSTARKSQAGNDLFPTKGSSYVPSGLTKEEYDKIKKKEENTQKKMNLGMWGPRFAQTDRPDGDWMTQPGLWTSGFGIGKTQGNEANNDGIIKSTKLGEWIDFTKRHTPAFFAVFAVAQFLQYAYLLAASALAGTLRPTLSSLSQVSTVTAILRQILKLIHSNWKLLIPKIVFAGFLACPMEIFVFQRLNRHKLWSKKRSFFTLNGIGLLALLSWFGILSGISLILS